MEGATPQKDPPPPQSTDTPATPAPVPPIGPAKSPPAPAVTIELDPTRSPLLSSLLHFPLKKAVIWVAFGLLLYILRDFFPLFFMTFVLSYIGTSITAKIEDKFSHRWVPVTLIFLVVVGAVVLFGFVSVPRITNQARDLKQQIGPDFVKYADSKLKAQLGETTYNGLAEEFGEYPTKKPLPKPLIKDEKSGAETVMSPPAPVGSKSLVLGIVSHIPDEKKNELVAMVAGATKAIWKGVIFLFMSIIFSYLLVLTLPGFAAGVGDLERSRFADVYAEVAPSIAQFARLMGRAFEAQTVIALMNTVITAIGMWMLGIPQIGLLSVGVFLGSFIPVAGVFISTIPIALAGLIMEGGSFGKLVGVVVMVTVAHIVEAYILNPKIYGHHMKMNPLAVLFILVLAEHTVGVWGLVIAVPFITYVWKHIVLGKPDVDDGH